ncbi:MAG: RNA-directed DNA polymerase [Endozoicomonadaceae bacterium]|nr:RNA-directed DNA polymerase [Endozoicomonadaceae bacterium]
MWSPQSYKKIGSEKGLSDELLETAITQSKAVFCNIPSILSLRHLACRTGISYRKLRCFVERSSYVPYKKFSIKKRSGGRRFIHVPDPDLMHVQRWFNEYVFKLVPVHPSSYAFTTGSSIKKCAAEHCGAQWLIKLDITDFFESVSEIQVFRLFKGLGYQPLVSFEMARLCTVLILDKSPRTHYSQWHVRKENKIIPQYNQKMLGYLPQGAASSPLISNLVMKECDEKLTNIANRYKLSYTRYSDDLSFSTRSKNFCRSKAKDVIFEVYEVLSKAGYRPQLRKTKIISPSSKKIILGLNVDGAEPLLQKEYKDKIRQHLYYIEKLGVAKHVEKRGFDSIWGFKSHLRGMIDYANMIEEDYAKKCLDRFSNIDWPV